MSQIIKYKKLIRDNKIIYEEESILIDNTPYHPQYINNKAIFTLLSGNSITIPSKDLIPSTKEDLERNGIELRTLTGLPSYSLLDKNGIELFDLNSEQIRVKVGI